VKLTLNMAENDDMTGDLSLVDHNRLQERLRVSKKQRTMQLKAYEQNEKRIAKQQLTADKKFAKKSKKGGAPVDRTALQKDQGSRIIFGNGVLMMDVIARKDIPECKHLMVVFSYPRRLVFCSIFVNDMFSF